MTVIELIQKLEKIVEGGEGSLPVFAVNGNEEWDNVYEVIRVPKDKMQKYRDYYAGDLIFGDHVLIK